MGLNLYSCCHRCKTKVFHFRCQENKTLMPFYYLHRDCLHYNPKNLETLENQSQEADWMAEDGYKDQWEYDEKKRCYKM